MGTVNMIANGKTIAVAEEDVQDAVDQGFVLETPDEKYGRLTKERIEEENGGVGGKVQAGGFAFLRGATLGLSDAVYSGLGEAETVRNLRDANPGVSTALELVGTLATAIPTGGGSLVRGGAAAANLARAGEVGSAIARVGRAGVAGAAEGAIYGAGSGVTELALSEDPLTLERVASTLSSKMLYGGVVGGAAGATGKLLELGLAKGRAALAAREGREVVDDLAAMDAKGLSAARKTELDAIKAEHKLETEALEQARNTERSAIADDIAALRREVKDSNQWATTKGLKGVADVEGKAGVAELGRMGVKAEKQLAGLLDNPIGLAKNPAKALDALQRQEHGLVSLIDRADDLKLAYVADGLGGKRAAALDAAPGLLEKNRALQQRISKTLEAHPPVPISSTRLEAIEAAKDALAVKANPLASIPQRMVEGSAFGAVAGAVGSLAIPGAGMAAPLVGAAISKMLGEKVFGRLGNAASSQAARASKVAQQFLGRAERAVKSTVPTASRTLAAFATGRDDSKAPTSKAHPRDIGPLFAKRAAEVRALVEHGPDGKAVMREAARAKVAEHLAPIGTQFPELADALEELAARRATFLADRIPTRPDAFANQLGPDTWRPSDMDMRKWARYVAGVEDPHSILDRVVDGSVSPEDAEVMREVYPEMLADLQREITEQAGSTKKTIPYHRRVALSRLTGVAIDPTMDPRIMSVIQAAHASEEGTSGGTESPRAQPQFGSVSKALGEPTPSQRRAS